MKLLKKLFGKKEVQKPHEFITNPPAAEMAEKRKKELELQKKEKERLEKDNFLNSIDNEEFKIDTLIRSRIQDGLDSLVMQDFYGSYMNKKKYSKYNTSKAKYLAARRFRKRGFKVSVHTIKLNEHTGIYLSQDFSYYRHITVSWKNNE